MRAAINNKLLATVKARLRPFEVRDDKVKGFILRVQPSGSMSFICEYRRGRRITIGKASAITPTIARIRAKKFIAESVMGVDPAVAIKAAKAGTFAGYIRDVYGPWAVQHLKSGQATVNRLNTCFAEFANRPLKEISPWLVEKWRSGGLKAGRKPTGINRDLDSLKAALAKAVGWGLIDQHPIASVKRTKTDPIPNIRFLSKPEETRLRSALQDRLQEKLNKRESGNSWRRARQRSELASVPRDHLQCLVLLALNTGMRRGELFALKWEDVDLAAAQLTVLAESSKTGSTRHLPLNTEAVAVLKEWSGDQDRSGHVFPGIDGAKLNNINRAWSGLMKRAKIAHFRFHDLRHHFASKLVMAGVDLNTVRELLGHSDIKMTLRYAHLAPEHKAAAVARLVGPSSVGTHQESESQADRY
jgi:integrase